MPDPTSAFDVAKELTTQLLTLSSGILAVSITFAKDIVARAPPSAVRLLACSWIALLVSLGAGLWHLMAMAGTLAAASAAKQEPELYAVNMRLPGLLSIACFFLGLLLLSLSGAKAMGLLTTPRAIE